jgi:ribA/ribD-fused uncharacterized protein
MPQFRTYDIDSCAVFRRTDGQWGVFSNMATGFPLLVNGIQLCASEALYQACRYPNHPALQEQLLLSETPLLAKMRSRAQVGKTRPDWSVVRISIMAWCLRIKLAQHYGSITATLRLTGHQQIVESSRDDDFWGATPSLDGMCLVGRNVLGRLWVMLRREVARKSAPSLRLVEPLPIENFLLLGRMVEVVRGLADS